jgi:hypothetical protein
VDPAEAGLGTGQADIGRQGQPGARAHGIAVDRGHDRLGARQQAEREATSSVGPRLGAGVGPRARVGRVVRPPGEGPRPGADVGAGAEGPPGAGEHHGADGIVVVDGVQPDGQLAQHGDGEGVETVGAVQRQDRHPVADLVADGGLGHRVSGISS